MTNIEWTNETWNPIIGCSKVSAGCNNCYAEKMALRQVHIHQKRECGLNDTCLSYTTATSETGWSGKTSFNSSQLVKPLRWKKHRMIFVVSMGDLFHKSVPFAWIDQVFDIISQTPRHTYQILTKRPDRMKQYFEHQNELLKDLGGYSPPPFIWLGVTAENQEQANKRIPILLQIPAAVRFVSIEPMLAPIDFYEITMNGEFYHTLKGFGDISGSQGYCGNAKLDWVICGGESGSKARPMHPDWARSLRDQCKDAKTPFFFKQWGELLPKCQSILFQRLNQKVFQSPNNADKLNTYYKIGKKKAGRLLDGKEHNEMPIIK